MVNKIKIILGLGVWTAVLPYLGFPRSLKNLLVSVSALGLVYLSYLIYKELKGDTKETKTFDNFSENTDKATEAS